VSIEEAEGPAIDNEQAQWNSSGSSGRNLNADKKVATNASQNTNLFLAIINATMRIVSASLFFF
jgi:hypothetical protein